MSETPFVIFFLTCQHISKENFSPGRVLQPRFTGLACMVLKLMNKNVFGLSVSGYLDFHCGMPVFYESLACGKKLSLSEERGQLPTSQTGGTQGDRNFCLKRGKKILEASMQRRTLCAALLLYALFPGLALGAGRTKGTNSQGRMTGDRAAKRLALAVRLALGKPYVWGARGPNAFDCSGLVQWLYRCAGLLLPRTALEQGRGGRRAGQRLVFGDVLLFSSRASPSGWHCGMYLARGYFVHAAGRGKGVIVSRLAPRKKRLVVARRYLA